MAPAALSAIVPVPGEHDDLALTFHAYQQALDATGRPYEMVWVADERRSEVVGLLRRLTAGRANILVLGLPRWQGEAAAIAAGLHHATGALILTLPGHGQIDVAGIPTAIDALDDHDMIVGRRRPLSAPIAKQLQARVFHGLVERLFGVSFHDLGCRLRACRRPVLEEIDPYGTQFRLLPLIAARRGFRVGEIDVAPGPNGNYSRLSPLDYARRALDVLSLFLLLEFAKRPLRFFGPLGVGIFSLGALSVLVLVASKLAFAVPLADRPALVLAVLLIVLGIQVVAVGLIGEIIVFAHGRTRKDYAVERIVGGAPTDDAPEAA